jgi:cytoskeletal protein RodZ
MTARHHIRIGNRRLGRDRTAIDATPAPRLSETLQLARERKGVDLYRAERDTKIRLKYLAALEDGHFDELPAPVYTKGFLRNYAIYLALDPEEVLERWREEMLQAQGKRAVRTAVAPPPRPIAAPRRGLTISAGWIMAALVLLAVVAFVGYIGMQLMRFAETPAVALTDPPSLVSQVNAESVVFAGTAGAGALVNIHGPDGQLLTTTADERGNWTREVPLAPGHNEFTVVANDPVTRRDSPPLQVIVTVPLLGGSPSPSPETPIAGELRLTLSAPADGATLDSGAVRVSGTTTGSRINITARSLDEQPATPEPDEEETPEPDEDASPAPTAEPADSGVDLTVPTGGAFGHTLSLAAGRWEITVTAYSSGLAPVSQRRTVTITQAEEMTLVLEARRGISWLRIVADGEVVRGWGGPTLRQESSVTVTATDEIWLRAGNAGVVRVILDGVDLGWLGQRGQVGNWIIIPGSEPQQTSETR